MDSLSNELHVFLLRLGREPESVSDKVEHYIKHILRLVPADEEMLLQRYYGLFGNAAQRLEDLAGERGVDDEAMRMTIETALRKIAVSPEWQMVKQL